jgi:YbbR domain-containing protein
MIFWFRYFKNLLLRNLQLKIVSLTLAVLLWIALNGEPKSEIGLKVPLEFRNSPKDMEVLGETNTVDIRLSASSSLVKRLDASEVTVSVDLSDWTPGERTYSLTESNLSLPFGVAATKITPNKIRLRFERTDHRTVKVRPRILGRPAEGYVVTAIVSKPDHANLEGPASHLTALETVSTDSLDISGRSSTLSARVHLYVDDPLVRLAADQETQVEVTIVPKENPDSATESGKK